MYILAVFDPSFFNLREKCGSYGFRPCRSCHDAIGAIFDNLSKKAKYVLEADISKCFDKINHSALLEKINTFPTLRKQINAWLKAGVMDNLVFSKTDEGSPQGGVISPHIIPTNLGGKNVDTNKQLLHRHCHDTKTTNDGSIRYS
ncbi:MAG: hypothetical protein HC903_04200 [Methylacidiphilales bacterium]|nr:hypothetical protein [Candidatus Methylacidiphilales bacterium]NJR19555.1 hypothetical protein [Calothrix sp. CSU_2_0]